MMTGGMDEWNGMEWFEMGFEMDGLEKVSE